MTADHNERKLLEVIFLELKSFMIMTERKLPPYHCLHTTLVSAHKLT